MFFWVWAIGLCVLFELDPPAKTVVLRPFLGGWGEGLWGGAPGEAQTFAAKSIIFDLVIVVTAAQRFLGRCGHCPQEAI